MATIIRPISGPHGVGFFAMEKQPQYASQYREENIGRYWNYYVTTQCYSWPCRNEFKANYIIDGFSPNLNKSLHVGHLRQLALAKSLQSILGSNASFVALLGASQGVYKYAVDELNGWFDFVKYKPEKIYYDVLMPKDLDIVPRHPCENPLSHYYGAEVWDGPLGSVVVVKTNGQSTYAFHDLAFAKTVGPTHYLTGVEQKDHFNHLGLGDRHLVMGLVMSPGGTKLKSRDGSEEAKAETAIQEVMSNLGDTCPEKRKLAWNVLAWNFLTVARSQNVKYDPAEWTKADAPGMYITYTYARIKSALGNVGMLIPPSSLKLINYKSIHGQIDVENVEEWGAAYPDAQYDLTQDDANLLGFSEYYYYHLSRSMETLDATHLATFAHDLARRLGKAYHTEKIKDGRYGFQYAVGYANSILRRCMWKLGMFALEQV